MAGFTLFDFTDRLLAVSMRVLAAKHELLSANIANADTPGYRPRDIDFAAILRALARPDNHNPVDSAGKIIPVSGTRWDLSQPESMPNGSDMGPDAVPAFFLQSSTRESKVEGKLDRNGVDLDQEIAFLSENSLLYETNLTLLSKKLGELRYAISEGKG